MKKLSYLLSSAVLALLLASVGCSSGGGDEAPAVDQVGTSFKGTWNVASVTGPDGGNRTSDYQADPSFVLTVEYTAGQTTNTYSASGGPSGDNLIPFKSTGGNWSFVDSENIAAGATAFDIVRNDGLTITVSNLTETTMTLTFLDFDKSIHDTYKTEAVDGDWTFTFTR